MTPRLSLCIATYNRAGFIAETLRSALGQATDEVEVVVVDGASTDETAQVVGALARQQPRLRYHRLDAKGGVDRDFDRAVELARGEYCWLFTDDDLLLPGAIEDVLAELRQPTPSSPPPPDLLVVNAEVRDAGLGELLQERRLEAWSDRSYRPDETDRLFADCGAYLTFIGAVVVRRRLWLERERERWFGSEFVHVGVLFQAPLPRGARVLARPRIAIRYGNAQWSSRAFEVWMFQWPGLVWSLPLSDRARRAVTPREPWRRLRGLMRMRAIGSFSRHQLGRLLSLQPPPGPLARWAARAVAAVPGPVANLLALAWPRRRGPAARLGRYDVRHSRHNPWEILKRLVAARPRRRR